jgi:hypothetical protein
MFCFVYEVRERASVWELGANNSHIKVQSGFVVLWGSAINETSRVNISCGPLQVPPTQFLGCQFYVAGNYRDDVLFTSSFRVYIRPEK